MFQYLFLALLVVPTSFAWGARDICDILDLPNCSGVTKQNRRSSNQSLPSPSTSASINPAAVSYDRGVGAEVIHQSGNPLLFSLASGSGRVGGALISTNLENAFFGNRVVELDGVYTRRIENKKQYRSKKMTLAVGAKLFNKKNYAVDAGLLLKRHSEIKKVNPGLGLSARFGPVTLGGSIYQDDFQLLHADFLKYPTGNIYDQQVLVDDYEEKFTVQTFSVGVRIQNLALDVGRIQTNYKFYDKPSVTEIISSSYNFRNYLFSLATRVDNSSALKYEDGALVEEERQQSWYTGLQVSFGKHVIIGVAYNYFLLREFSLNASVFF